MRFLFAVKGSPQGSFIRSVFAKAAKSTMVGSPKSAFVAPEKKITIRKGRCSKAWKDVAHIEAKPRLQDLSGSPKI